VADDEVEAPELPSGVDSDEAGRQRKKRLTAEQKAQVERDMWYKALLATAAGRRQFYDILFNLCGMHLPLTNLAMADGYTLFREGARQVGLDLQTRALQADRDQYIIMLAENLPRN